MHYDRSYKPRFNALNTAGLLLLLLYAGMKTLQWRHKRKMRFVIYKLQCRQAAAAAQGAEHYYI